MLANGKSDLLLRLIQYATDGAKSSIGMVLLLVRSFGWAY